MSAPYVLTLSTLHGENALLRKALRIKCNSHGLVQMAALDPAYEPLMLDLMNLGMWSQELGRTATVADGAAFLRSVEQSLVNSSYWTADWTEQGSQQ